MFSTKGVQDDNVPEKPVRPFTHTSFLQRGTFFALIFFKILSLMLYSRCTEHTHIQSKKKECRKFKVAWSKAPGNFINKPMHSMNRFLVRIRGKI